MARVLMLVLCLAGCRRSNPDYCDQQTPCEAPLVCDQVARECIVPQSDMSAAPDLPGLAMPDMSLPDLVPPRDLFTPDFSACTMTTCNNNAVCRMACGTLTAKCQNNKCQP